MCGERLAELFFVISTLAKILALTIIRSSTRASSIILLRHILKHITYFTSTVLAYQQIADFNFAYLTHLVTSLPRHGCRLRSCVLLILFGGSWCLLTYTKLLSLPVPMSLLFKSLQQAYIFQGSLMSFDKIHNVSAHGHLPSLLRSRYYSLSLLCMLLTRG